MRATNLTGYLEMDSKALDWSPSHRAVGKFYRGLVIGTVKRQAQRAGIGMPEVAIYDSPDINAFATGIRRNHALIAVSTGLWQSMGQDEVAAVLAHPGTDSRGG